MSDSALPLCSFVIVNYNGLQYLHPCLQAVYALDYPRDRLEVILVDNGSTDDSLATVERDFPEVVTLRNPRNNFAAALNLGIVRSHGEFVAFLNNDAQLDAAWLRELLNYLQERPQVGAVAGKIRFRDGRINSVGHRRLENHYWEDIGYGEADDGQYDKAGEREGLCWAATLFRRDCLADVGEIDEDFVMYFEDVEYAQRCRDRGWGLHYVPSAIADHEVGGSSTGTALTEYFCNRNRFLYLAKHEPHQLLDAILTSVFWIEQHYDRLYDCLPILLKKLFDTQPPDILAKVFPPLCERLVEIYGARDIDKLLARLEVVRGDRKPTLAIYDNALHFIGGGQRYLATLASILQDRFDITFLGNKPVRREALEQWYGLDLSRCHVKIIPLPFFERRGAEIIDSTLVTAETENPFEAIALESKHYDFFLNANQLTKVCPLSPISVFFCHFPDTQREAYFAGDRYTFIVTNSQYTSKWLRKLWRLNPSTLIYPPVQMQGEICPKEPIILSVGRFEAGGSKKQLEMIEAFSRLCAAHPQVMHEWRLVLVGGSSPNNPYLEKVRDRAESCPGTVEIYPNASLEQVQQFYAKSSLFWHLCGLDEMNPERFEHFGMATVEAMQNGCIPIVFNGGGQPEIIESEKSGFLINSLDELCQQTHQLLIHSEAWIELQDKARDRGKAFDLTQFKIRITEFFETIEREYATIALPNPAEIAKRAPLRRDLSPS